jgi:hypothetical protein
MKDRRWIDRRWIDRSWGYKYLNIKIEIVYNGITFGTPFGTP